MSATPISLEACPFCGCEPETAPQRVNNERLAVWCEGCDAMGPEFLTGHEAIAAWNRRSPPIGQGVGGWRMVPVEPTREMWAAMGDALVGYKQRHHDKVAEDLWTATLSSPLPR